MLEQQTVPFSKIQVFKATNTLDGYISSINFTEKKELADYLLIGGKPIDLGVFPRLKGIFKTGVGLDNLPFEEATKKNVRIGLPSDNTKEIIYEETADFSCGLIFNGIYSNQGDWENWTKKNRRQTAKLSLLIVGSGKIGTRVKNTMNAFMEVMVHDK